MRLPEALRVDVTSCSVGSNWRKCGSPALALRELLEPRGPQALKLRPSTSLVGLDSHPAHQISPLISEI